MVLRTIERKNAPPAPDETKAAIELLGKTVEAGLRKLTDRIDNVEKLAARPRKGETKGTGEDSPEDLAKERKALATFARTGDDTELKAMSTDHNPDGGYLVMPHVGALIQQRIFDASPMRGLSRVEPTTTKTYQEPVDVSEITANWVGERSARAKTTTPQLKQIEINAEEIEALQPVTQTLLDDVPNLGEWIEGRIGDKFGRAEGAAFVVGDGILKPRGFMTYDKSSDGDSTRAWMSLQFVVSGSASAAADADGQANGLKDLYWALRSPYRKNATWLMASSTANAIDKLKDANKDYIWRDGMTSGAPPSLLGRPVEFDENMPAIGAGEFPIAFGDFKRGYLIVDRLGIRFLRDNLTEKPNVLFYAYRRVGGGLANSEAIKLLKIAAS